jgi:hypothetical protein
MTGDYGCSVHGDYSEHSHHCPECILDAVTCLRALAAALGDTPISNSEAAVLQRTALIALKRLGHSATTLPPDHLERVERLLIPWEGHWEVWERARRFTEMPKKQSAKAEHFLAPNTPTHLQYLVESFDRDGRLFERHSFSQRSAALATGWSLRIPLKYQGMVRVWNNHTATLIREWRAGGVQGRWKRTASSIVTASRRGSADHG